MEKKIRILEDIDRSLLFGNMDLNMKLLEEETGVSVFSRDDELTIKGENVDEAEIAISEFMHTLSNGETLDKQKVSYIISLAKDGIYYSKSRLDKDIICFNHMGRPIKPKTLGQREYVKNLREKEVCFAIGPAGTGKTYIAVAMACDSYKNKEVQKIILARPAVEAGERLGFLPGDLQEKVDPYLRPLYDALYDVLGRDQALRLKEKEVIEVVPLAYMRGRTLDNSYIILDEAQNATCEQMKMFLTRMGFNSRIVVTGDVTQIDLPQGKKSGLIEAEKVLKSVKEIGFSYLREQDVVRHEMVRKIVGAYDAYYSKHNREDNRDDR